MHSLVFGGFSAEARAVPRAGHRARSCWSPATASSAAAGRAVKADRRRRRGGPPPCTATSSTSWWSDRTDQDVPWTAGGTSGGTTSSTPPRTCTSPEFVRRRAPAVHHLHLRAPPAGPRAWCTRPAGTSPRALTWAHWAHFDRPAPDDVHWCTADLAWVTAHTYEIYGPLANGLTQVIYEGTPDSPHRERHLEIIERYGVTTYYTAPTLIRTFMTLVPRRLPARARPVDIRLLGTVGEAINPEAWVWFRRDIGRRHRRRRPACAPMVDTWWQSEIRVPRCSRPCPGCTVLKPGSATRAAAGHLGAASSTRPASTSVPGEGGLLVVDRPVARDGPDRSGATRSATSTRLTGSPGTASTAATSSPATAPVRRRRDIWLLGRLDDVVNVSGHRLSTIEIESALVAHPRSARPGSPACTTTTGQAVAAFVVPAVRRARRRPRRLAGGDGRAARRSWSAPCAAMWPSEIGPVAKPRHVLLVPDLPKTRSGQDHAPAARPDPRRGDPGRRHLAAEPVGGRRDRRDSAARRTVLPAARTSNAEESA